LTNHSTATGRRRDYRPPGGHIAAYFTGFIDVLSRQPVEVFVSRREVKALIGRSPTRVISFPVDRWLRVAVFGQSGLAGPAISIWHDQLRFKVTLLGVREACVGLGSAVKEMSNPVEHQLTLTGLLLH
jgi:hypothetical protein